MDPSTAVTAVLFLIAQYRSQERCTYKVMVVNFMSCISVEVSITLTYDIDKDITNDSLLWSLSLMQYFYLFCTDTRPQEAGMINLYVIYLCLPCVMRCSYECHWRKLLLQLMLLLIRQFCLLCYICLIAASQCYCVDRTCNDVDIAVTSESRCFSYCYHHSTFAADLPFYLQHEHEYKKSSDNCLIIMLYMN